MLKRIALLLILSLSLLRSETIHCEGQYTGHLQGIDSDGTFIYWSFTNTLVKTDMTGKIIKSAKVTSHCGDISVHDGKIYASINQGKFNRPDASKDSLHVFNAETLELLKKYPIDTYHHGFGAVEYHNGHLFLTGGLPKGAPANIILEYTEDMQFVKRHETPLYTNMGIQTLNYAFGHWWYGVYDKPGNVLCDDDFKVVARPAGPSIDVGMAVLSDGTVLIAKTQRHEVQQPPEVEAKQDKQDKPAQPVKKKYTWTGTVSKYTYDSEKQTLTLIQ